jgi:hypothetical protein
MVASQASINIAYEGSPLGEGTRYWWSVRTWSQGGQPSPWAPPQAFTIAGKEDCAKDPVSAYSLRSIEIVPQSMQFLGDGGKGEWALDFGRQGFGWLELDVESPADGVRSFDRAPW